MRQFFKFFFASFFGTITGLMFLFFFFLLIVAGISAGVKSKDKGVKPNSVLHINLNYDVRERTDKNPFSDFSFSFEPRVTLGLNDIIKNIKAAKTDDNIKGIYLETSLIPSGMATMQAVRDALIDFKTSEKFIVAYGEVISQKGYYLASVADEIYLNPRGMLDFRGFNAELMFLKGMLDKLGIEAQVMYAGKYKSATEPLRLEKMSDENREQITFLINDLYRHFIKKISESRNIPEAELDSIADNMLIRDTEDAVKYNMVTGLAYYDEILANLKEKTGRSESEKINSVTLERYNKEEQKKKSSKEKIAVLYAEGGIVDGKGRDNEIGSEVYAKAIREIRENDKVKALVFRINSGGGSVLASEVILREVQLAKQKMPVIVSMGDVAASGGYYIACHADSILAEPNTITGSIGVFGFIPNMQGLFNNHLGITFDGVKTGNFSDLGNTTRPLTAEERNIIQIAIDSIYMDFKNIVSKGRGMTVDAVDEVAQGRVWTGTQALSFGLVDALGNLDDAIAIAADKAGLTEYSIKEYPKQKEPFEKFMEGFTTEAEALFLKNKFGEYSPLVNKLEEVKKWRGVQARLPFDLEIY